MTLKKNLKFTRNVFAQNCFQGISRINLLGLPNEQVQVKLTWFEEGPFLALSMEAMVITNKECKFFHDLEVQLVVVVKGANKNEVVRSLIQ